MGEALHGACADAADLVGCLGRAFGQPGVFTFDLPVHPAGMAIEPNSGILVWTPTAAQVGLQYVLIRVEDGQAGVDVQPVLIQVSLPPTPPVFTSTAPQPASIGQAYEYDVQAQDSDHGPLVYRLGNPRPKRNHFLVENGTTRASDRVNFLVENGTATVRAYTGGHGPGAPLPWAASGRNLAWPGETEAGSAGTQPTKG